MSNVIMFSSIVTGAPGDRVGPARVPSGRSTRSRMGTAAPNASGLATFLASAGRSTKPVTALSVLGAGLVGAAMLRRRYLRWGATDVERTQALAGDELLPAADMSATRAIAIDAAADVVWPWIAQLGQGRGGFYSYDWLENLIVRADIHNADRIVADWQQIAVGAEVRLAPEVKLQVAALEPRRAVVLRGAVPMGQVAPPYDFTWAFVLLPQPDGSTRLVVRERYEYARKWAAFIVEPAAIVSCLMTPKMLRGIKSRAEHTPIGATGTPSPSPAADGLQTPTRVPTAALPA